MNPTQTKPLSQVGDEMQSALSRIIEYVRGQAPFASAPYEVCMALLEGESAMDDWTKGPKGKVLLSRSKREGADSAQSGHSPEPPTPLHSSTRRPRLLDLFSGAGGAAMGYHLAGFDVLGVDIVDQPNYPFDFHRANAMDLLRCDIPALGFDAIHASPPCQSYSVLKGLVGEPQDYPKLIGEVRERLQATGLPWVIENVGGARSDLRNPIQLCGSSFGLRVWRHRLFEMCHPPLLVPPCSHRLHPEPIDVTGSGGPTLPGRTRTGGGASRKPKNLADARDAMGIDWMNREELSEAIPPAFTEWIGHQRLATVPPTPLGDPEERIVPGHGNHCPGCTALLNGEAFRV